MPATRDLPGIYRGDPYDHVIAFGRPDAWIDVSDRTFQAKARPTRSSEVVATFDADPGVDDVTIEWTNDDGTTTDVTVPAGCYIVVHLDADDTRIEHDAVRWDLQQTAPTVVTLLKGSIPVDGDITR